MSNSSTSFLWKLKAPIKRRFTRKIGLSHGVLYKENACELLRVRTKYHEHMRKSPKKQFKHHLPRPIIRLITVLYLIIL